MPSASAVKPPMPPMWAVGKPPKGAVGFDNRFCVYFFRFVVFFHLLFFSHICFRSKLDDFIAGMCRLYDNCLNFCIALKLA